MREPDLSDCFWRIDVVSPFMLDTLVIAVLLLASAARTRSGPSRSGEPTRGSPMKRPAILASLLAMVGSIAG
jgi:hypothetical protein